MTTPVLVLDFDGTVCVGDDPVLEYGRAVASQLSADAGESLTDALTTFLDVDPRNDVDAEDGYQLIARLALSHGLDADALGAAYRQSRERLLRGELAIWAPEGLRDLLLELREHVHIALVTNAPQEGIDELLERLDLADVIAEAHGDAGKPDSMPGLIAQFLERFGLTENPAALLSVGDLWVNDLKAAHERGCMTALIDRFDFGTGTPDMRARDFPTLYPAVKRWSREARVTEQ